MKEAFTQFCKCFSTYKDMYICACVNLHVHTCVCVPVCRCVLCMELLVGLTVSAKKERKWKGKRVNIHTYIQKCIHLQLRVLNLCLILTRVNNNNSESIMLLLWSQPQPLQSPWSVAEIKSTKLHTNKHAKKSAEKRKTKRRTQNKLCCCCYYCFSCLKWLKLHD